VHQVRQVPLLRVIVARCARPDALHEMVRVKIRVRARVTLGLGLWSS
jgi:hypothetical protein